MRRFTLKRQGTYAKAPSRTDSRNALPAFSFAILALASLGFLAALVPPPARAQGSRKDDIVFNAQGRPMGGAMVRVCTTPATGQPCAPLANIYSDPAMTQALANPLSTDGLGNYTFYAAPGLYEIEISGPGITTKQLPNVIVPNDPNNPTFASISTTTGLTMFSLSLSGNLTVNGSTAITGTLSVGGAPVPSTGEANIWTQPQSFAGPSPWIDITAFPSAPACSWNQLSLPSATISLGTPTTASLNFIDGDYVKGCGVYIPGAGPNSTIGAPSGGTIINHNGTGSTTYKYKVVAVDPQNGYGPASAQFQTTTGIASMNKWQYNFLQWTAPSGTVKEYVIYSDEGLGGALVKIGTSYFPTFEDTGFYGANMQPSPSFLPTNPPGADGPQGLFTSITNVSGMTVTLANAASTAVTSQLIYLDNYNAVNAAVTQRCTVGVQGLIVQVGSGRWPITRWPNDSGCDAELLRLIGDLVMVDGPLAMNYGDKFYGTGSPSNQAPFGNAITSGIVPIAGYGAGGDQLGAVVLGNVNNILDGISSFGFQGDFIQFGDTSTDYLDLALSAAAHSGGCGIHTMSQIVGPFYVGGTIQASSDAGGKAAICKDSQFGGGGGSLAVVNIQLGSPNGKQLNWKYHFLSWACPICTSIPAEDNNQISNTYGETLLENGAAILDPGTAVSGTYNGIDDLYNMTVTNVNNDTDHQPGPCFAVLNPPNHSGFGMYLTSMGVLGCSSGTTGEHIGVMTVAGSVDLSYPPPITLASFGDNVGYNFNGPNGFTSYAYGINGPNAILGPNFAVSLAPSGTGNCVQCWTMPAPTALSIAVTHSAGTLPAGVHCYVVTGNDKQPTPGNTAPSPEACVTNLLNDENVLSYTVADTGLSGVTIWRGTASGGENVYLSGQPTTSNTGSYTDTGAASTTSGTPSYTATAYDSLFFTGSTGSKGFFHGNAANDGLSFGFGCPPSGSYVWETCGNTAFDNNVTVAGNLTAGGRTNFFSAGARVALTDAATISFNTAGTPNPWGTVTLGGNRTLSVTNMVAGGNYMLNITQDGTGSRTLTLGTGGTAGCARWYVSSGGGGAVTLTTTPGATDLLGWKYDGTNCWAVLNTNFN